ncbi:hypothetical protein [Ruegeria aquimaris]|uniref:Transposase n=1 Tax=Ruegeria aquimaris TaxID=2984333 RepID=A0ABT3ALW7_9RHOB|nr:hypothetical protein [Ruegeria sp. XHP0148]MCV2889677.1 hypothetical protein [Ruegeria sp. XHP0148]
MPSRDHQVLMARKLELWSEPHTLRNWEIERELAARREAPPRRLHLLRWMAARWR